MNNLSYQKQAVSDLEYKLFTLPAGDLNFKILKKKRVTWQGLKLDFVIIGASHFVKINANQGDNLVELVACVPADDLQVNNLLQDVKLKDNHYNFIDSPETGFAYRFNSWTLPGLFADYQKFQEQYPAKGATYQLDYLFPSPEGLAVTSIEIMVEDKEICWITYHSYPEEQTIIKTLSKLQKGVSE